MNGTKTSHSASLVEMISIGVVAPAEIGLCRKLFMVMVLLVLCLSLLGIARIFGGVQIRLNYNSYVGVVQCRLPSAWRGGGRPFVGRRRRWAIGDHDCRNLHYEPLRHSKLVGYDSLLGMKL